MNRRLTLYLFVALFALTGTALAFIQTAPDSISSARKEKLSTFEKSFKPSEYDDDIELLHKKENQPRPIVDVPVETFAIAEPETVQGFRIQVFASNNYDEAVSVRNSINLELPVQWVYMVYDAPTLQNTRWRLHKPRRCQPCRRRLH